jgi:hypothetical protein
MPDKSEFENFLKTAKLVLTELPYKMDIYTSNFLNFLQNGT